MAVVIGKDASNVSRADAAAHVAAVTIVNDTTARDLQWVDLGKNHIVDWFCSSEALDQTSPVGPNLTSMQPFIGGVHKLDIKTTLDDQVMRNT